MPLDPIGLPRIIVLEHETYGKTVVLECLCGEPVPYPGFAAAPNPISCRDCGQTFHAVAPATLTEQVFVER